MSYDRKIKYVDAFENGEKVRNAGFVKLEERDERISIHIKVSNLKRSITCMCPIILVADEKEVTLGELLVEQGEGCYVNNEVRLGEVEDGITYNSIQEVRMNPAGGLVLRCVISDERMDKLALVKERDCRQRKLQWKSEAELLKEAFVEERRMLAQEVPESAANKEVAEVGNGELTGEMNGGLPEAVNDGVPGEMNGAMPEAVNDGVPDEMNGGLPDVINGRLPETTNGEMPSDEEMWETKTAQVPAESKWQQLWNIYPHINPFEDCREYLLVKPIDFVVLREKYYGLTTNSFLLHGYYNYNHLIMARDGKRPEEKIYIGVPGNFYEKEKQAAVLFGFESFEGRQEPVGTGDFGYYMVSVEI